jgi:single-strand DNA-binding protein
MNIITVAGNLTRDAEQRALPNGTPVLKFSVADNSSKADAAPTIFWDCCIFGKYALAMNEHLYKGRPVTVVGSVVFSEWVSKDGTPQKRSEVRVNNVALQGSNGQSNNPAHEAPRLSPAPQQRPAAQSSGFHDMADDLPF